MTIPYMCLGTGLMMSTTNSPSAWAVVGYAAVKAKDATVIAVSSTDVKYFMCSF